MRQMLVCAILTAWITANVSLGNPTDGVVAYYPLDGDAKDFSGNANHGIVYGAQLTVDRFGRADHAYLFDGQTNRIEVPHSPSLDLTGPITLSAWIKSDSTYWQSEVISKTPSYSPAIGYQLYTQDDKARMGLTYPIGGPSHAGGGVSSTTSVIDGQWHLMTATYDGAEMRMYIDGRLETSVAYSDDYASNTEPLTIGYYYYPYYDGREGSHNWAFNGAIDDVRIYNRALGSAEIRELAVVPAPSAVLLVSVGLGISNWCRRRRVLP